MPGLDGWETTRRLRALEATARTPIIALTAYALVADRTKSLEAGCNDFETKPIELPRLLEKIAALVGAGSAA
jgi:CheY-like chemotaxis protein